MTTRVLKAREERQSLSRRRGWSSVDVSSGRLGGWKVSA
jgi:hypothetical protein